MDKFFNKQNAFALKRQEIQLKFADGVIALHNRIMPDVSKVRGLGKLVRLKEYYETQLSQTDVKDIDSVVVCFRCFDKESPCTDCD